MTSTSFGMTKSAAKPIVGRNVDARTMFTKSERPDITTEKSDSTNAHHHLNNVQNRVRVLKRNEHLVAKRLYRVERQRQISQNKRAVRTNVCTPERDRTQFSIPTSPSDVESSFAHTSDLSGSCVTSPISVSGSRLSDRSPNLVGSLRKIAVDCAGGRGRGDEPLSKRVMTPGKKHSTTQPPVVSSLHSRSDCKSARATLGVNQSRIQSIETSIHPSTEGTSSEISSTSVGSVDPSVLKSPHHIEPQLLIERPRLLLFDESTRESESPHTNSLVSSALLDMIHIDQPLSIQSPIEPQKIIRTCSAKQIQPNAKHPQPDWVLTSPLGSHSVMASPATSLRPQSPHSTHVDFTQVDLNKGAATDKITGSASSQVRPSQDQTFSSKAEHKPETTMNGVSINRDKRSSSSPVLTKSEVGRVSEIIGRILDELVITERSYCRSLLLFPRCLPDLYSVHIKMLHRMDSGLKDFLKAGICSSRPHPETYVSLPFAVLLDSLSEPLDSQNRRQAPVSNRTQEPIESTFSTLYKRYLSEFTVAMKTMRKLSRQSSRFKQTLKRLQQHPECDGFDFSAFLLAPVQRLPRYLLLIKQLSRQFVKLVSTSSSLVIGQSCLPINIALVQTTQIEERLHNLLVYLDSQLATYLEKPTGLQQNVVCSPKDVQADFAQRQTISPDIQTKPPSKNCSNGPEKSSSEGIWPRVRRAFSENKKESISEVSFVENMVNQSDVHRNSDSPEHQVLSDNPQLSLSAQHVTTPQQALQNYHMIELDSDDSRCKQPNINASTQEEERKVEFQTRCLPTSVQSTSEQPENTQTSGPELESFIVQPFCNTASLSIPSFTDSNTQTSPHVAWSIPLIDPLSNNFCNACKVTLLTQPSDAVNDEQSRDVTQMATYDPTTQCPFTTIVQRHTSEPLGFLPLSKARSFGLDDHILSEEQIYFSTTQLNSSRWDPNNPNQSYELPYTVTSTANVQRALSDPCKVHLEKNQLKNTKRLQFDQFDENPSASLQTFSQRGRSLKLERTKSVAVVHTLEGQKLPSGKTGSSWKISLRNLFRRKAEGENSQKRMSASNSSKNAELTNIECEQFNRFNDPSLQNVLPTTSIQTREELNASSLLQRQKPLELLSECNTFLNPASTFVRCRYPIQTKPTTILEQELNMATDYTNIEHEVFIDETGNPCFEV
ncbi:hypothetical protein EG68_05899 [Paragonimus skrjabini miyazakii]|uniref:DH domain-containing protein n=1 Tax=Paragonimus skrjabini miyazakii TaxID=59628 RepID=A0A8S9Y9A7_9TREM|nr:hypothetical protein EG68_05899 [Paragonimus skrjabini miyazakii]